MSVPIDALLQAAAQYGCPLYVYDGSVIAAQYHRLTQAFAQVPQFRVHYAMKALSNVAVLQYFQQLGSGIDAVSIEEVQLALHAGFTPADIIFTPNGVSFDEIDRAAQLGVRINIDNLKDLEWFGQTYPHIAVGIRLNPHIMAGGHTNISVGHIDSKFGISIHQLPLIKRIVHNTGMCIHGLHMHTGSDILDVEVFLQAADILFEAAVHFDQLQFLDFGSGFKVPYGPGDAETDIEALGVQFAERFNAFCDQYGRQLQLLIEPGKFLVSASGYLLAQVNGIKQTTSTLFAQLETGLNHLIRPMLYGAKHPIYNLSHPEGKARYYTVVGYICETDTFGNNVRLPELHEGHIVAIGNAGAYGFSMSSHYNARLRPAEVLLMNGQAHLIRERESFDDLLRHQRPLPKPE